MLPQRIDMIDIHMCIPDRMYEVTAFEVADLCDHGGKEGVGSDVEGHTEAHVCGALVHL